jgi:hypothetical protein
VISLSIGKVKACLTEANVDAISAKYRINSPSVNRAVGVCCKQQFDQLNRMSG